MKKILTVVFDYPPVHGSSGNDRSMTFPTPASQAVLERKAIDGRVSRF
jgi:hypothetical protein